MSSPDSKEEQSIGERENINLDTKNPFLNSRWSNKTKKKTKQFSDDQEEGDVHSEKQLDLKSKTIPSYPLERWGHQAIIVDQYLYLIGGYIEDIHPQAAKEQIYRLDCETYEWEKVICSSTQIPEHRDSHTLCLIQGKIFMFGGKTPDPNEKVKNDLWIFDPIKQKHEWRRIDATGAIPPARESHQSCAVDDRYMIVFGGTNGKEDENFILYDDMYIFDSQTNIWREVTNKHGHQIEARDSFAMANVNGFVYIFGGQGKSVGQDDIFYNDFYKLKFNILGDGKSEIVEILPVLSQNEEKKPCVRASHSMCVFKKRYIFIIAGEKGEDSKLDDIQAYDIEENMWMEIPQKKHRQPFLKPIISHSSSVYKDQIIIFGGLMKDNNTHSDQTLVLSLNCVEDPKSFINGSQKQQQIFVKTQDNKKTCSNCEIVYNLTEQQNEKQQQLSLALKNIYIDDEDNIRIDVDREKENLLHLYIQQNDFKAEDGGNDTEFEKTKPNSNDQNHKSNNIHKQKQKEDLDTENSVDKQKQLNENTGVGDKGSQSENYRKHVQNKNNLMVSEKLNYGVAQNNQNGNEAESKLVVKKDENTMDEEQFEDQSNVKEESQQEDKKSSIKQEMYEFEVKEDSVLESEDKLKQQEQRNKIKKELSAQQHQPHHHHHSQHQEESILNIRQPYISMSFLNSISNLIGWPFAAFGLLIHNAKSQSATIIEINLMYQKKKETYVNTSVPNKLEQRGSRQDLQEINNYSSLKVNGQNLNQPIDKNILDNYNLFLQFYDDSEGFSHNDFIDIMYKFDNFKTIQQNKSQKEMTIDESKQLQKAQYGNNIKLAGLRLGQNVLFISKNKTNNTLNVGLISTNGKINPNLQECIIFLFSFDMKQKTYLTESGDQNKRIILNSIAHIMNEEQIFKHDQGNHIYIFDLRRIPSVNREGYEFSYNHIRPDIVTKKKTLFKDKKDQVERLIDFSLKSYIQHLYIKTPDNMHFSINGQKYEFISYFETLKKQKGLKSLKELNTDSYQMVKDSGRVTLYEQIIQNKDSDTMSQQQKESSGNFSNESNQSNNENKGVCHYQGILIYQDERLISRAEATHFGSYFIDKILNKTKNIPILFKYVGIIELDKFFQPNLFYTGLDNSFQEAAVRQSLKQFLKSQKQCQQKSDKIRPSCEKIEEPELRKEIKTD